MRLFKHLIATTLPAAGQLSLVDKLRVTGALMLASAVSLGSLAAQAGTFTVFGHGCPGTGPVPVVCGAHNTTGGTSTLTRLPNEYCYHHKAASAITVIGIRLFTKTFVANSEEVIRIGFYRELAGAPRQAFATSGSMLVKSQEGFYIGYFTQPVVIAKDEEFWISQFDSNLTRAAGLSTGTAATNTTYWRPGAGGSGVWAASSIVKNPSYHILCEGTSSPGTGIPNLTHTGLPAVGKTFYLNLHHAPANPAAVMLGFLPQNVDLQVFGAPGCRLLTTLDFIFPAGTPVNGSLSIPVTLPTWPILKDVEFYCQFYVFEPTINSFQLTTTNGGKGRIGI